MRQLEPLAHIALLLVALLACGGGDAPSKPGGLEAGQLCAKLVAAKVARNCVEGGPTADVVGIIRQTRFTVLGLPNYEGTIRQYGNDEKYQEWARNETDRVKTRGEHEVGGVPSDEYPERTVLHAPTRTIVDWGPPTGAPDNSEIDRWEACRKTKTVAACAKMQPALYAATKAVHEATKHALGMK